VVALTADFGVVTLSADGAQVSLGVSKETDEEFAPLPWLSFASCNFGRADPSDMRTWPPSKLTANAFR